MNILFCTRSSLIIFMKLSLTFPSLLSEDNIAISWLDTIVPLDTAFFTLTCVME